MEMALWETLARIVLAMAIGGVIGWEREITHRPAGLRTHMMVCVGAAVVMLTGYQVFYTVKGMTNSDPARLGAQVISGIGFLGAGTIMRDGLSVKGLTTAASLWVVACLGLAVGAGAYSIAIIGTVLMIAILTVFEHIEQSRMAHGKHSRMQVTVTCQNASQTLKHIGRMIPEFSTQFENMEISEEEVGDDRSYYTITFLLQSRRRQKNLPYDELLAKLTEISDVTKVQIDRV